LVFSVFPKISTAVRFLVPIWFRVVDFVFEFFPPGAPVEDLESNEKGNLALASYHLTGQQVTWIRYFVKVQRRQKASKQTGAAALRAIQK
jgi:hypothetical protein